MNTVKEMESEECVIFFARLRGLRRITIPYDVAKKYPQFFIKDKLLKVKVTEVKE